MKRPDYDAEVNVVGTVNVLEAATPGRAGDLRLVRRRRVRRVPRARRPRTSRSCRFRRTASPRSAARSTSPAGTAFTARLTSRFGSRTSTGPARTPGSKAASSRSSSSGWRDGQRRSIFGDGGQAATSSTSTTSSPRCSPPSGATAGRSTSAPASRRRWPSCTRPARRSPGAMTGRARRGPARGRSALRARRLADRRGELGWRPQVSLADGLERTWNWTRRKRARRSEIGRPGWMRRSPHPTHLIRPWRTATLVASLVAAIELVASARRRGCCCSRSLSSHAMQRHARGCGLQDAGASEAATSPCTAREHVAAEARSCRARRPASAC